MDEMKVVIKENTWTIGGAFTHGWGNGYVLIPIGNTLHGVPHNDIDVNVHGGLSFSELMDEEFLVLYDLPKEDLGKWCVGFDTGHYGDDEDNWSEEAVQKEAESLAEQLTNYNK